MTDLVPEPPKLYSYAVALYERMLVESTVEEVEGSDYRVWRGFITKTVASLGIPDGTYKRITDRLSELGCIEQVSRGYRGNNTSVYILHIAPTIEVWEGAGSGRSLAEHLTSRPESATLSARVEGLERRLEGIDIKQALVELQKQIRKLQDDFQDLQDKHNSNT
jgi:hypothetical protein